METPELDARVLLCHAAGVTHEDYVANPNLPLSPEAAARFAAFIARRLQGEPVSRILSYREFYGREFRIDQDTLDPRPDTETLIEAALDLADREAWRHRPIDILDLGTGSGAILLTLLAELPQARGVGGDLSLGALDVARANAEALGVAGERASSPQIGSTALPGASIFRLEPALHCVRRDCRACPGGPPARSAAGARWWR